MAKRRMPGETLPGIDPSYTGPSVADVDARIEQQGQALELMAAVAAGDVQDRIGDQAGALAVLDRRQQQQVRKRLKDQERWVQVLRDAADYAATTAVNQQREYLSTLPPGGLAGPIMAPPMANPVATTQHPATCGAAPIPKYQVGWMVTWDGLAHPCMAETVYWSQAGYGGITYSFGMWPTEEGAIAWLKCEWPWLTNEAVRYPTGHIFTDQACVGAQPPAPQPQPPQPQPPQPGQPPAPPPPVPAPQPASCPTPCQPITVQCPECKCVFEQPPPANGQAGAKAPRRLTIHSDGSFDLETDPDDYPELLQDIEDVADVVGPTEQPEFTEETTTVPGVIDAPGVDYTSDPWQLYPA